MKKFTIKFFGSKKEHEQIKLTKMLIVANNACDIENILRCRFGYKIINGLKIHDYE